MVSRYKAGERLASIGASLGFTLERVRQVVKQSGAHMPWEDKCAVDGCFTSPRTPMRYCRSHQRRLERCRDRLANAVCRCDVCRKGERSQGREHQHRVHPEMRRYQGTPKGQAKPL